MSDLSHVSISERASKTQIKQSRALVYAAFVAGLCSIVYELLIATTVSFFLGDSVTYFSVTIGLYMAAMGAGSYSSKYIGEKLVSRFLALEVALAAVGGLSIPILYFAYAAGEIFMPTYVVLTLAVGFLIGLEIPFLTRLMENFQTLKSNIANILSFDYVGALVATLAFPFFLLPTFGAYQSSIILGLVNLSIVLVVSRYFRQALNQNQSKVRGYAIATTLFLIASLVLASEALKRWDAALYSGDVVHTEQSRYQKIVITKEREDVRLYLNGNIQFSSIDEYRYHEALVLYPMAFMKTPPKNVLLMGAGDGLAVKQMLSVPSIERIVLVDLDEAVVELALENPYLLQLNQGSLTDTRVEVVTADAFGFLNDNQTKFDLIICDLPDPNNLSLARLYTRHFYRSVTQHLTNDGVFVTQASSPYFATKAYWSIVNTVKSAGFEHVIPYHTDVPSFGDWGFVMASRYPNTFTSTAVLPIATQYLTDDMLPTMQLFGLDSIYHQARVNRLDSPVLLDYYLEGWRSFGY